MEGMFIAVYRNDESICYYGSLDDIEQEMGDAGANPLEFDFYLVGSQVEVGLRRK